MVVMKMVFKMDMKVTTVLFSTVALQLEACGHKLSLHVLPEHALILTVYSLLHNQKKTTNC